MNGNKNQTRNRGTEFNYNDPTLKKIAIEIGMQRQSFSPKQAVPQINYSILLYIKTMTGNQQKSELHDTP